MIAIDFGMRIGEVVSLGIKSWSVEDRPREKLEQRGCSALSDAELLAILIRSGTATHTAVDVSRALLQSIGHDLHELARMSLRDLMRMKGIGKAKALSIMAAIELGRRRIGVNQHEKFKITCSRDAFDHLSADLLDLPREEFWVLLLNRANRVMRKRRISEGGVSGTVADPKIIFKFAVEELASGVIVAHNHPSGNLTASPTDIELTKRLKEAGRLLEIQLLDHLIVAGQTYFSFADDGMI